ncbi:transposase [Lentzea guizhouensis]|uniref:Transposase n=1 Tax=Lentzea guizhouensis TaxID=1586287 RepID=A0A1B2HXX7_9PSEU|nr:IS110 family transposase [Lentzea guizhouensis]ANZ42555.1 transposase [Lentzea guizhouensis]
MAVRERIWVGIDVGKIAHHASAVDETGKVVFSQRVDNGQVAIEQLVARAGKAAAEVRWAVDLTSGAAGLLVMLLLATGQPVTYVSGQTVNRMAGAFGGEGKTDAKDARIIAETSRMRGDLPRLSVPDQVVTDLAVLTARRADLMNDWVRDVNRLRELLSSIFPALEKRLDCTTRAALTLLTGFQTPAAVRDAGEPGLTRHLHDLGVRPGTAHTVTAKALAAAAEQTAALPAEAVTAPLIARLSRQLLDLDREAKDLTKQIGDTFRTHPQAAIIESLPGLGPVLGAEFLVGTGGDLSAFRGPDKLAAFAGLAPMPRDSGRVSGNRRKPRRYYRGLRRVFYMAALVSTMREGPSKTFYQRKRTEGKHHVQALIALARRLVDVLWALLRDNRPFTPAVTDTAAVPTAA